MSSHVVPPDKLCVNCRSYRSVGKCAHPAVAVDPVGNGQNLPDCHHARASDGRCGPEGRFWERRELDHAPAPRV